jgi:hypothetical protein
MNSKEILIDAYIKAQRTQDEVSSFIQGYESAEKVKNEDLEEYLEVHYDIVRFITEHLTAWEGDDAWSTILKKHETQGGGGIYPLAKQWADEFTEKYKDIVWGEELEYYDTLEDFLTDKNNK